MPNFKIHYPAPYAVEQFDDDNIDIQIVLPDKRMYAATAFAPKNLLQLMEKLGQAYFYSPDMFVVQSLRQETLRSAIAQALEDGSFFKICAFIGTTDKVYDGRIDYEAMQDWPGGSLRHDQSHKP